MPYSARPCGTELYATEPPTVQTNIPPEPGTASSHPRLCSSTSTACQIAPVCTVTIWLSKSIFSTAFIRSRPSRMQPSRMPWPMKVEDRPHTKIGVRSRFARRTISLTCSVVRGRAITAGTPPGLGPQSRVWQMRSTSLSLTYSRPQIAASPSTSLLNWSPPVPSFQSRAWPCSCNPPDCSSPACQAQASGLRYISIDVV